MNYIINKFMNKYNIAQYGNGPQKIFIFQQTGDLLYGIRKNTEKRIKIYKKFIPKNFTCYIFGYNEGWTKEETISSVVKDYALIIKEEEWGSGVALGMSFGGFLAIEFASKYPELTEKLVLMMSAHSLSKNGVELCQKLTNLAIDGKILEMEINFAQRYDYSFFNWTAKHLKQIRWEKLKTKMNPIECFIHAYEDMIRTNGERKKFLKNIKVPTLVLGGTVDPFFSVKEYEETASLIQNNLGRYEKFEKRGHLIPIENFFKVRNLIHKFLKN